MNFFEAQAQAKRNSTKLLLLLGLVLCALGLALYLSIVFAVLVLPWEQFLGVRVIPGSGVAIPHAVPGLELSLGLPHFGLRGSLTEQDWWHPQILLFVVLMLGLLVGGGAGYKLMTLGRNCGEQVASSLGGRRLRADTRDLDELKLHNIVEEMAIASGLPTPAVYILDREDGINAFAAGISPSRAVVGVTRGAIATLTRDELQGVVAHEFSHILNGDMRLNVRLIALAHGLLVISLTGRMLLRLSQHISRGSRRGFGGRGGNGGQIAIVIFLAGVLVAVFGALGLWASRFLKSAVSRQREYLADAAAVQFTRNPQGISDALRKVLNGVRASAGLQHPRAEEVSHLLFEGGNARSFLGGWFASHPPLAERIQRIQGRNSAFYAKQGELTQTNREGVQASTLSPAMGFAGGTSLTDRIGIVTEHQVQSAHDLLVGRIPPTIHTGLRSPWEAQAIVIALVCGRDERVSAVQKSLVSQYRTSIQFERYLEEAVRLSAADRLPIAQLAIGVLRELNAHELHGFLQLLEALVRVDGKVSIFEFAVIQLIRIVLDADGSTSSLMRLAAPASIEHHVSIVLSAFAQASRRDIGESSALFRTVVQNYPRGGSSFDLSRCSVPSGVTAEALANALAYLSSREFEIRHKVLEVAERLVTADQVIQVEERELLRVLSAAFDCPMPMMR